MSPKILKFLAFSMFLFCFCLKRHIINNFTVFVLIRMKPWYPTKPFLDTGRINFFGIFSDNSFSQLSEIV